jgi:hypothetical protein
MARSQPRTNWGHLLAPSRRLHARSATPVATPSLEASLRQGAPRARILSLGAGVQSTTLLLLAAEGRIEPFDAAIFADTGWEPRAVYEHLDRLESQVAGPAGIPIERVSYGNLREDSLSGDHTVVLPLFVKKDDGSAAMLSRQCTQNYKVLPIYRSVRRLLGASETRSTCTPCEGSGQRLAPWQRASTATPGECSVCRGSGERVRIGSVPPHSGWVEMSIGFSTDEIVRVSPSRRRYAEHRFPLIELGWSRTDALNYLDTRGFQDTPRSACVACPYHSGAEWTHLRESSPIEWEEAVAFDALMRNAPGFSGSPIEAYVHRSCAPLSELRPTDQADIEGPGCSPFGCRSEAEVDARLEDDLLDRDEMDIPVGGRGE